MKYNNKLILWALFIFIFAACSDDEGSSSIDKLSSSQEILRRSVDEMAGLIDIAQYPELKTYLEYDVKIYEITYKTSYKGEEIIASGLVTFPETENSVPMMSFQHGTLIAHNDAPTVERNTYTFLSSLASAGYIFLIPDFIGFGSSTEVLHPYYHKESTANSIVDMLVAVKELAIQEGYNYDGNVFLSGYSEGGYATMAAHQALENDPIEGFNLVASAPSSGGYDVKGMQEYFFNLTEYDQPFYMAYVALSYKSVNDWTTPLSTYFQEPYATTLPGLFDGTNGGGDINAALTTIVADYVNPTFLEQIDTNSDYEEIATAFEENSLDDWVPTKRMFLYHGTADITVPYQNSIDTYEKMQNLGASTNIVSFTSLEGATHGTGFFPYLYEFLEEFDKLK